MKKVYSNSLIKNHFVIDVENGKALLDTGCPYTITPSNCNYSNAPEILRSLHENLGNDVNELHGMSSFKGKQVLFDYKNNEVVIADEKIEVENVVTEFALHSPIQAPPVIRLNVCGITHNLVFDSGASNVSYINDYLAKIGSFCDEKEDYHVLKGKYFAKRYLLPVEIAGESFDVPFAVQLPKIQAATRPMGIEGVIGIDLYQRYKVLLDMQEHRLVLCKP